MGQGERDQIEPKVSPRSLTWPGPIPGICCWLYVLRPSSCDELIALGHPKIRLGIGLSGWSAIAGRVIGIGSGTRMTCPVVAASGDGDEGIIRLELGNHTRDSGRLSGWWWCRDLWGLECRLRCGIGWCVTLLGRLGSGVGRVRCLGRCLTLTTLAHERVGAGGVDFFCLPDPCFLPGGRETWGVLGRDAAEGGGGFLLPGGEGTLGGMGSVPGAGAWPADATAK